MTLNQRIFADEYIKTRNATRSYMLAYPKIKNEHTAQTLASRLLGNDVVSAYIDEQLDKLHNRTIADAAEIMQYYTAVMRGQLTDEQPVFVGNGVQEIKEVRTKMSDRNNAADKLAKMLGIESQIGKEKLKLEQERAKREEQQANDSKSVGIIEDIIKAVDNIE